ncbi:MAG: glycoside hydrolase family 88 protein [Mediterranea sp.]|jgi:unsaturated rhamnogalacturonyl hydrolase|nr:glycoside hydrolase family 88 protein [Mediterranea sp.]
MKKNLLKTALACTLLGSLIACAAPKQEKPEPWSQRIARSEMKRFPEPWMIEKAKHPRWGYTHGLVMKAMLEEWKHTGDTAYYNYAKIYVDSLIEADGRIKTMNYLSFNLDNVNPGKILFDFYARTHDKRYRIAMDTLRKQLSEQPRTSSGGFWHKLRYPHQMWLDGIYMASPFLAQYGATFHVPALCDEAAEQIQLIGHYTYDRKTGLYYHGWDESHQQAWANPETGCSPSFWSRSIGWYAAGIVDVLDYLPANSGARNSLIQRLRALIVSLVKYQDPQTGTWYQVTDQGARPGNYLESSATALFVYAMAKALNKGYIDAEYSTPLQKAFDGMIETFVRTEDDGTYTITNCCAVAGLGGNADKYRDGSFDYYISEPVIQNDPKSVGAFILAAIEYEKFEN